VSNRVDAAMERMQASFRHLAAVLVVTKVAKLRR
jgi:hypothetical protein